MVKKNNKWIDDELRKELIDYHKWFVSLIALIFSFNFSVLSFKKEEFNDWMSFGWVSFLFAVFFSWLIVRNLISLAFGQKETIDTTISIRWMTEARLKRLKCYQIIQNWLTVFGVISLVVGFLVWKGVIKICQI